MAIGSDQPSTGPELTEDPAAALGRQLLPERFEVLTQPLGWRCRSCGATVFAERTNRDGRPDRRDDHEVGRLAETAADHGLYCGRCDD